MSQKVYAHFIGAGGAGMSGLALVLAARGHAVTGSDLKESRYSRALSRAGIPVAIGHDSANLPDTDIVVVSSAIPDKNPEIAEARRRGIDVWPRAKMLAHLSEGRKTVAVAGTHGKTSTSSMTAVMLSSMGLDPTFLIGGEVDGANTNAANGSGDYYVVEADESDGSFVFLNPHIAVITNIEADHMDHYSSIEEIEQTFAEFMDRTDTDGAVVVCGDDPRVTTIAKKIDRRVVTYGEGENCDVRYSEVSRSGIGSSFTVTTPDGQTATATVSTPGIHMVSNACAAIAVAWTLGLDIEKAAAGLKAFSGVRRRFDLVSECGGVTIVDDYAHHPTEVLATLRAAADLGFSRVWALFQPHRYSRTLAFSTEFGAAFAPADRVVLMDVYSAGEAPIPGVSGKTVLDAVLALDSRATTAYLPHRADVVGYLADRLRPGDLLLTMGAGDVTAIGPELAEVLESRERGEASGCQ